MIFFLKPKTLNLKPIRGFTLVEMLIVIALIAIIALVTVANLVGRKGRRTLDTATSQLAATFREAESRALAQTAGTAWGVHLDNTTTTSAFYALFSSSSYAVQYEVSHYRLPAGVFYVTSTVPAGASVNIVFSQLTGYTVSTTVGLTMVPGIGTSTSITISGMGLVSF